MKGWNVRYGWRDRLEMALKGAVEILAFLVGMALTAGAGVVGGIWLWSQGQHLLAVLVAILGLFVYFVLVLYVLATG